METGWNQRDSNVSVESPIAALKRRRFYSPNQFPDSDSQKNSRFPPSSISFPCSINWSEIFGFVKSAADADYIPGKKPH